MRLSDRVHLIGSGTLGFSLSDAYDCNVYLIAAGDEALIVDAGAGRNPDLIVQLIRAAGFHPESVRTLLLTHAHGDHAGGAAGLKARLGTATVAASPATAAIISTGDERLANVEVAKRAGIYPADYRLQACAIDEILTAGEQFTVGDVAVTPLATPGHCADHISLLVAIDGRTTMFAGDALFAGGHIQLQAIDDCDIAATMRTLRALRKLPIDELYAGHGAPVLQDASAHVERANQMLDQLRLPPQMDP